MDFIHANVKSISQEIGFFVILDGTFLEVWPVTHNNNICAGDAIKDMCYTVGIPQDLKTDQHSCFKTQSGEFKATVRKAQIYHHYSQPQQEGQMHKIDNTRRRLKQHWQHLKLVTGAPN